MAKTRKKKQPVTNGAPYTLSNTAPKSVSGHHLIRRFHVLLKRREALLCGSSSTSHELSDTDKEIESLGGLEAYQRMSVRGQSDERGGGSEKIFVNWLKEEGKHKANRIRLLEVGALKHDNYACHSSWIDCMPIDLRARHPLIHEQDFLKMDEKAHTNRWDAISLSLVINFVPNPHDRGKMLTLAHSFLHDGGDLFVALPLPCVANSRYLSFDHFKQIMTVIGFTMLKERWKNGGKMAYWLFRKNVGVSNVPEDTKVNFKRKVILREGKDRNNFTILL